jgi:hypothetical protein
MFASGPTIAVNVGSMPPPALDALEVQLDYQYQVKTGDINADGKVDVYVKRTSGGVTGNGVIESTILLQSAAKQFDSLLSPTSSQINIANNWPVASNVETVNSDFNVDGYTDVLIKDLDSVISNVQDQVVYSSAEAFNGNAQSVTAVTEDFQLFFRDVYNWILDPNYFDQAITASQPALNYGLVYGAQTCYYFYGFSSCAIFANYELLEVFTLSRLGLSAVNEAQAKVALANEFGLPNYDAYVCVFVCELEVSYGWDSSIAVFAYDAFVPTTVGPGFDDVNFSLNASEFVENFGSYWFNENSLNQQLALIIETELGNALGFQPQVNDDACYVTPASIATCATIGVVSTAVYGVIYVLSTVVDDISEAIDNIVDKISEEERPPCITITGRVVAVGTIGYRPLDVLSPTTIQHGIQGSHHNIYSAQQNPHNGQCFWKPEGAVKEGALPSGSIPIEPFVLPVI